MADHNGGLEQLDAPRAQQLMDAPPPGRKPLDHALRWSRALEAYPHAELRALQFRTVKDVYHVIDLTWSDPDLTEVPHAIVGGRTLIFPVEAIESLRAKGLKFTNLFLNVYSSFRSMSTIVTPPIRSGEQALERRNAQPINALEVTAVVGEEREVVTKRSGTDEEVAIAYHHAGST